MPYIKKPYARPTADCAPVCKPPELVPLELPLYDPCTCYAKGDPTVLYEGHLAQSLTEECNKDNPLVGALKRVPTWVITPIGELANRTQTGCGFPYTGLKIGG